MQYEYKYACPEKRARIASKQYTDIFIEQTAAVDGCKIHVIGSHDLHKCFLVLRVLTRQQSLIEIK